MNLQTDFLYIYVYSKPIILPEPAVPVALPVLIFYRKGNLRYRDSPFHELYVMSEFCKKRHCNQLAAPLLSRLLYYIGFFAMSRYPIYLFIIYVTAQLQITDLQFHPSRYISHSSTLLNLIQQYIIFHRISSFISKILFRPVHNHLLLFSKLRLLIFLYDMPIQCLYRRRHKVRI